ncbi:DUF2971 domain-containing protein [Myroides sp. WP-1]|uniref:DUF2971 domain-containing protein n=1 Tax=Myroides sp. WP-1 TaxID=2759944 RepID=UPI0015FDD203|nr:DUF2971 domain-containing protein [Myroides sp. WP-1]MBB1137993.1 DUF2971 domain-containing protein [Myroides sp. WP-1]
MSLKYFYKYYTINQNLYSSIINNELYFSNPRNFNDPFDSYPRIVLTSDIDKLRVFFTYIKAKVKVFEEYVFSNPINKEKFDSYIHALFVYNDLDLFREDLYTYEMNSINDKIIELSAFYSKKSNFDNLIIKNRVFLQEKMYYDYIFLTIDNEKLGISCGSKSPDCPLMWGHYADNHKGLCVKYQIDNNLTLDNDKKLDVLKVKYSDNPIKIFDYSLEELDNLKFEILSNKYSKWEYENEIRLINQEQGLLKINRKSIREIIFGCKSTPKNRYTVLKLFATLGYDIQELKIAKRLPDQYQLSIQEMIINDIAGSGVYLEELNTNKKL